MKVFEAPYLAKNVKFAIVASRFNEIVTKGLLDGAASTFRRHGVEEKNLTLVWVPGAWEIPVVAKRLAASGQYDSIICLGCVIKGQTSHFEYVAGQAASGIMSASLETNVPLIFGVLTTENLEQALARSGATVGNKGAEAAAAALEMANLFKLLP